MTIATSLVKTRPIATQQAIRWKYTTPKRTYSTVDEENILSSMVTSWLQ
ncbi:hypothetical protein AN403_5565 [Pseudomonas fluorescens]|uniref:Uncharacterized protein n=1 Tax=Pseudomonas fluorescens TaxID=294 RepID=A0A0P8XLF0_PSEFL|nr:hypothetical protein AN403_5565 [Pseudomonas fluorescens]